MKASDPILGQSEAATEGTLIEAEVKQQMEKCQAAIENLMINAKETIDNMNQMKSEIEVNFSIMVGRSEAMQNQQVSYAQEAKAMLDQVIEGAKSKFDEHEEEFRKIAANLNYKDGNGANGHNRLVNFKDSVVDNLKDGANKEELGNWLFKLDMHIEHFPDWKEAGLVLKNIKLGK